MVEIFEMERHVVRTLKIIDKVGEKKAKHHIGAVSLERKVADRIIDLGAYSL